MHEYLHPFSLHFFVVQANDADTTQTRAGNTGSVQAGGACYETEPTEHWLFVNFKLRKLRLNRPNLLSDCRLDDQVSISDKGRVFFL
jgi:hypothetical protein